MLSITQAVILGLIQGVTELFPISSLGHSVILPSLLGWNVDQKDPFFLVFLVATHFATAIVLFLFFWQDWKKIFMGVIRSFLEREIKDDDKDAKLGWLLIIGTIPAGILGVLFEDQLKNLFATPRIVSIFLILNGVLLLLSERLRKKRLDGQAISSLSFFQAIKVGGAQALALLPGFSRTGSSIGGGLLQGLSHTEAARFSFLLATPIIGAAAALKLPELYSQAGSQVLGVMIIGALSSAIAAYFSVKFLTKYFKTEKLTPFGIYCLLFGLAATIFFFR